MKPIHLLGLLLVIVILVLGFVKIMGEGFSTDQQEHDEFSLKYQRKYNKVGNALVVTENEKALGQETGGLFGSIQDTMDSAGKPKQYVDNPYPLEGGRSGMFALIDKCEAKNTVDCSAFDDVSFKKDCGMCLDIGTNSKGVAQTGGLVLTEKDKTYAQSQKQSNFLAPYAPTVGTCPNGKMVASKAECLKLKAELECQKGNTFDTPAGCAQCYNDGIYHVVDPTAEGNENLIRGSGTLMVIGSGTVSWTEPGHSNTGSYELSTTAKPIPIVGGENSAVILTLTAPIVATPYDSSKVYRVNDRIIYNNGIFIMQEGAGAPGYNPSRPGDKLWKLKGSYANYKVPPSAYIAGYLNPSSGTSGPMDMYRLILTDTVTTRKPRTSSQSKVDGYDVTNMAPGLGKNNMIMTVRSPFTFVDETTQEASLCPNSPFITKADSATLLGSDPCYAKGSGPGKYNIECLQNVFYNNGCGLNPGTLNKSGYPSNQAKANLLQFNSDGDPIPINEIADVIYSNAVMTATGVDPDGNQLSLEEWSVASLFCSGVAINSPCQGRDSNGKLTTDCIVYLWDNQGENKIPGATYNVSSLARSLFSTGTINRFCTRSGTLAPKDLDNKENAAALAYWKGFDTEAAVKNAMSRLHMAANSRTIREDDKADIIKKCYGLTMSERAAYSTTFTADTGEQSSSAAVLTKLTNAPSNAEKWRNFASSRDGSFIIGVYWNGISISRDKGLSWSSGPGPSNQQAYNPDSLYFTVACSDDGTKVIMSTTNGGPVWVSTNSCASWTKAPEMGGSGYVACSGDGSTMYASFEGWHAYISRNSGASWTKLNRSPEQLAWRNIACSSTGQYAIVVEINGKVAVSNNFGQSWTLQTSSVLNTNTWSGATCSSDGSQMAVYNQRGQLYKSFNSGSSWTNIDIRPPSGFTAGMDLSSSADGRVMAVTYWPGGLGISSNGGTSWSFATPTPLIHGYVDVSPDGSRIIVGDYYGNGDVYSYRPPAASPIRTGAGWSL